MDEKLAMELFENGEAFGVYANIILMEAHGKVYFSFDCHEWHEAEHPAFMDCIKQAKI
jgi:hypothetical protein